MKSRFILPACMAMLGLLACRGETENADLKTLSIDSSLKSSIAFRSCEGDCAEQEINFVHNENGREIAFQKLYRGAGAIAFDGEHFHWTQNGSDVVIGRKTAEGIELCSGSFESVCNLNLSVKYPDEAAAAGAAPVYLAEFSLVRNERSYERSGQAQTNLLKYVIPSPNQEDAGSCHYMAATGAMEVLLNQSKDRQGLSIDTKPNGSSDISEAYLMNIPGDNGDALTGLRKILGFNNAGSQALSNYHFPFWNSATGKKARDNWKRPFATEPDIRTPEVALNNIYGGASIDDKSKWDVAVFGDREIEAVKDELRQDRPVVATYNHFGYWHVVVIVGYDDTVVQDCSWVTKFMEDSGSGAGFPTYQARVKKAFEDNGGCRQEGVFYVRDSLGFGGGADRATKYSARSYEWLRYLGNHAYSVYARN